MWGFYLESDYWRNLGKNFGRNRHKIGTNEDFLKLGIAQYVGKTGAPGTIRTCDPQYRKLMLYPAELRVHFFVSLPTSNKDQQAFI